MDTRTGRIYPSKQAALDAGVPERFIVEMHGNVSLPRNAKRSKWKAPHQNDREMARRRRLLPTREKTAA